MKKNLKTKRKRCLSIIFGTLLIAGLFCFLHSFVVTGKFEGEAYNIGIIDDSLLSRKTNVIYQGEIVSKSSSYSHGETLLKYLKDKDFTGKIYYFSAQNQSGKIDSESLVKGLNWLKGNGVKKINISLSSKNKSELVEKWINDNPEILIFCSYNNQINSYDYPAMFDRVIASGSNSKIKYKENDKHYCSNKLLIINKGIHFYNGNSYLSLETLLEYQGGKFINE